MITALADALVQRYTLDAGNLSEKERLATESRTDCREAVARAMRAALPVVRFRGQAEGRAFVASRPRSASPVY